MEHREHAMNLGTQAKSIGGCAGIHALKLSRYVTTVGIPISLEKMDLCFVKPCFCAHHV